MCSPSFFYINQNEALSRGLSNILLSGRALSSPFPSVPSSFIVELLVQGVQRDNLHAGEISETNRLQHLLGIRINLKSVHFNGRNIGDVVVLPLTLFLLELEGDTADGTLLNSLHQMGGEPSNLVPEALGGDDSNLIANLLVGLEIQSQTGVVLFNNEPGGLFDCLGSDATLKEKKALGTRRQKKNSIEHTWIFQSELW